MNAKSRRKRLDEARRLLRNAADARKRWQTIAVLSADIESIAGKQSASLSDYERAVAFGPRNPLLIRELAAALDRERRFAEAESFRDSVAPAGLSGGDRLAIDLLLGDREFAAAADRALAVVDPATADTTTLLWLGGLCLRAGRQEKAIELFTQATRVDPSNPDVWIGLARCRMGERNTEAAAAAITAGLAAVAEDDRRLLAARGAAVLGRTVEAEREFRDGVKQGREPTDFAARLVEFLVERGRGGEALVFLQEVVDRRWGQGKELQSWAKSRLDGLRGGSSW